MYSEELQDSFQVQTKIMDNNVIVTQIQGSFEFVSGDSNLLDSFPVSEKLIC